MRVIALTFIALALGIQLARTQLAGTQAPQGLNEYSSYINSNRYDFRVTEADLAAAPPWRIEEAHPPLGARKALQLARTRLAELVPDHKNWTLEGLTLREWQTDGEHWYYLAVFEPPMPRDRLFTGPRLRMTIPVLMSGQAVKPVISKWPK